MSWHHTEETKLKMSLAKKGKPTWNKGKRGLQIAWNKGIPHSEEVKNKMREIWQNPEYRKKTHKKRKYFSDKDLEIIKNNYAEMGNKELLKLLGKQGTKLEDQAIDNFAQRHKLRKSKECLNRINKVRALFIRKTIAVFGKPKSEEAKLKMREAKLKNPNKYWKGKTFSEGHRQKLSDTKKAGLTEEVRRKLREIGAKAIMPLKDTSIEIKIQNFLKQLGIPFFTHQYMNDIEHVYRCDILIPSSNMVIECDGDYWHNYPIGREIDHIRTKELLEKGFRVLRLWEREINSMSLDQFKEKLK